VTNPFLNEILKNPDEDMPRLIYADWLEEQGDARGEFIRVQCELAEINALVPEYFDLQERSATLLTEHGDAWARELQQDVRKADFHRGFIDTITMTAKNFVKAGEQLLATVPVHWLRFNYVKNYGEKLAACAALEQVRYLDISQLKIPLHDLLALLSSPFLTNLKGLRLDRPPWAFPYEVGRAIATSAFAESLERLEICSEATGYSPRFFAELASGDGFPQLKHLSLASYSPDYQDLEKLFVPNLESLKVGGVLRVRHFEQLAQLPVHQLKHLDLSNTGAPAKGIEQLLDGGAAREIEYLNLFTCTLSAGLLNQLFSDNNLQHCKFLNLGTNDTLRSAGKMLSLVEHVAGHPSLSSLERLFLTHLADAELTVLGKCDHLSQLLQLEISASTFDASGMQSLFQSNFLQNLRRLTLQGDFQPAALSRLKGMSFPKLLSLYLIGNWAFRPEPSFDEQSAIALFTEKTFPALRVLSLAYCGLTDETLSAIAAQSRMPELRQLLFDGNWASTESVREVLTSKLASKLRWLSLSFARGISQPAKLGKEFAGRIGLGV
jgi:uncharacterized protein (TIGR02996 family)